MFHSHIRMRWSRARLALCALIKLAWSSSPRYFIAVAVAQVVYAVSMPIRIVAFRELLGSLSAKDHEALVWAVVVLGLVLAIGGYFQLIQREKSRLLGELVMRAVLERVLDAAQSASLVLLDDSRFHDRVRRVQQAQGRCGQALSCLFSGSGAVLGAAAILFTLTSASWLLLPVAVIASVPVAFASRLNSDDEYLFMTRLAPTERRRFYIESLLLDRQAAKEVRAFDLAPFLRSLHGALLAERVEGLRALSAQRMRRLMLSSLFASAGSAMIAAVLILSYFDGTMSLTSVGTAFYGFVILATQLRNISRSGASLYEALLYVGEIDEFVEAIDGAPASEPIGQLQVAGSFVGITMEDVTFTYPTGNRPAVNGISLRVEPGELVAFVGPNGSGKTTVAKLLAGLYTPDKGCILWGDVDRARLETRSLRDQVAIGFQDFERFRMSVSDNIALGRHERRQLRNEVIAAAERAGARRFSAALPDGFDTALGPEFAGGHELSQGQWQRLALARVFFRDAGLVILDEPTAALDALAEFEIFEAMRRGLEGRGAVLISHRLATVRNADRIYVFEQGNIAEVGRHADLLEHEGLYARMFELQASSYLPGDHQAIVGVS